MAVSISIITQSVKRMYSKTLKVTYCFSANFCFLVRERDPVIGIFTDGLLLPNVQSFGLHRARNRVAHSNWDLFCHSRCMSYEIWVTRVRGMGGVIWVSES